MGTEGHAGTIETSTKVAAMLRLVRLMLNSTTKEEVARRRHSKEGKVAEAPCRDKILD